MTTRKTGYARRVAIALTSLLIVLTTPSMAQPNPAARYLANYPGGIVRDSNTVTYGPLVVEIAGPSDRSGKADCPQGFFCFYDNMGFGYPRGKLSECGWQDLSNFGWNNRIESVYYNMSSGSVSFIDHGEAEHHSTDTVLFTVSAANRSIADISPHRNQADHVFRQC